MCVHSLARLPRKGFEASAPLTHAEPLRCATPSASRTMWRYVSCRGFVKASVAPVPTHRPSQGATMISGTDGDGGAGEARRFARCAPKSAWTVFFDSTSRPSTHYRTFRFHIPMLRKYLWGVVSVGLTWQDAPPRPMRHRPRRTPSRNASGYTGGYTGGFCGLRVCRREIA